MDKKNSKLKKTFMGFELTPFWSLVNDHNHYTKEPTMSMGTRKSFQ